MDQFESAEALKRIAAEAFGAIGDVRQIQPFSSRPEGLTLDDAYRVTPLVRQMYEARGAKPIGRKIGFTNRTIWAQYGVHAPIWGYVFDRTTYDLADIKALTLAPFSEPRLEPEIIFGLARAPAVLLPSCRPASAGSRSASRSCSRSIPAGNFPRPTPSPPTACTARC
jgi:2-oxo-3-hexenedioate decarboxylase